MEIIKLNAIDSTNSFLKELNKKEILADGLIVVAHEQTNGRGQLGTSWQSQIGESLTFSMFKRFSNLSVEQQSGINFAVALAMKNALERFQIPEVSVKWPNDIMSYQKKLSGILIENQLIGKKIVTAVMGIGLNVNETQFKNLPQATSMYLNSGIRYNLDEVLNKVSESIILNLNKLEAGKFSQLKEEYEAALFRKDKITAFEDCDGKQFNGIIKGVSEAGELLLETETQLLQKFQLKEIRMLF